MIIFKFLKKSSNQYSKGNKVPTNRICRLMRFHAPSLQTAQASKTLFKKTNKKKQYIYIYIFLFIYLFVYLLFILNHSS